MWYIGLQLLQFIIPETNKNCIIESLFCFSTNFCRINTEMCSWVVQTYRFTLGLKFTLEIQGFLFIPGDIPGKGGYYNTITYINNSRHLAWKYPRIFVCRHYLFREMSSFPRRSSRKTVRYEEQIMSKDIVFIIL